MRGLGRLPTPIRLALTLPVAAIMFFTMSTAFMNKWAFESDMAERAHVEHRVSKHRAAAAHHHDESAYYPSEHQAKGPVVSPLVWAAVAAGGAGGFVLFVGFGLFSWWGSSAVEEEEDDDDHVEGNPFLSADFDA